MHLGGEVLPKSHTGSKHSGTALQHTHIHEAVRGASAVLLTHPKVLSCWLRAAIDTRRADWQERNFTPARWLHQGSSHSLPAPPQTDQLFKQFSVSLLSATSIMGSTGHFDNQIQHAHSFFRSIKKSEIENFSHQIAKKITTSSIPADSCVQRRVIGFFLERDLMSTFVQTPHIPRYLQQQIHQTLQLTHTPPSVPSLQLYLYLSEKHRGKSKRGVNANKLSGSGVAFFFILPLNFFFFSAQVPLSNTTFLKTERTQVGRAVLHSHREVSASGTCLTALESKKPLDNQRNSPRGGGESRALLHSQCPFNTRVLQQHTHGLRLHAAVLSALQLATQHLHGCRSSQVTWGEAFKALERQEGTHDKTGNVQKQQNF